jgi:four helix bundle protein
MGEDADALRVRSKQFAIRVVKLFRALPSRPEARVIGNQLLRCGTSVAANYRAACRARSHPDFISKMGVVVEETDESIFWLEMLVDVEIFPAKRVAELIGEANELLAIFAASQLTAKQRGKPAIVNRQSAIVNSAGDRSHV